MDWWRSRGRKMNNGKEAAEAQEKDGERRVKKEIV